MINRICHVIPFVFAVTSIILLLLAMEGLLANFYSKGGVLIVLFLSFSTIFLFKGAPEVWQRSFTVSASTLVIVVCLLLWGHSIYVNNYVLPREVQVMRADLKKKSDEDKAEFNKKIKEAQP